MYIMITSYLKGKDNIHIKYISTGNNSFLMKPKCLVFEVSFVRTFDSKKQGQLSSQ